MKQEGCWKDRLTSPCILSSVWERKMKEVEVGAVGKRIKLRIESSTERFWGLFFKYIITKLLCCYHYCIWQKELIYKIKNIDKEKIESMWPLCFLLDTSYLLMSSWMMHWRSGRGQNHGLKKNIQQNNWHH